MSVREEKLNEIRKRIFITGYKGGMAHLASCFSCIEILYSLYIERELTYDPKNPKWENRDRFILSKGHAGLALYVILYETGLVKKDLLLSYLNNDFLIGGEPCIRDCEWIEATTGSLGHGLSIGVGMAIGLRKKTDAKVYVLLGDGECEEGSVWEAAQTASAYELNNLVVIIDSNKIQKMDFIDHIIGKNNTREKWESFGFLVDEVDGHNVDAICDVFHKKYDEKKPRMIIANTVKGKGVSIMENNPTWHFKLPNRKEVEIFKKELLIDDCEMN